MTMSRRPERSGQLGPDSIGEAIRLLRYRARLTRDELAPRAGVSAGAVSNYENDVSVPPAATLRRLAIVFADVLDADLSELWDQLGDILDRQAAAQARQRPARDAEAG